MSTEKRERITPGATNAVLIEKSAPGLPKVVCSFSAELVTLIARET